MAHSKTNVATGKMISRITTEALCGPYIKCGRSSAISRRMSPNRFRGMMTSAIWKGFSESPAGVHLAQMNRDSGSKSLETSSVPRPSGDEPAITPAGRAA